MSLTKKRRPAARTVRKAPRRAKAEQTEEWSEPTPLGEALAPVARFEESMLPEVLCASAADAAERLQTPLDFPAAASIVCLSGAAQRRIRVQPKTLQIDWQEPTNLWGALIGAPGVLLKSPVLRAVAGPLYQREKQWARDHAREIERHQREEELAGARGRLRRREVDRILQDNPLVTADDLPAVDQPLRPPLLRRLIVNDATYQKLQELLIENPAGMLCIHDELTKLLSDLDQAGNETARSFFLQSWNGNMPWNVDRLGRGEKRLDALSLAVLGGIAPDRLRSYLTDVMQGGPGNDGLIQRISVAVWPDVAPWKYVDLPPLQYLKLEELYTRVFQIDPENPVVYRFCPGETQGRFIEWLTALESEIRSGRLEPGLVSHIAKYRKLVPVLAALYAFADGTNDEWIELVCLEQAIRTSECLRTHAARVYSCVASASLTAARNLLDKIRCGFIATDGVLHTRELYRHCWTGLNERAKVTAALDILVNTGHLRRGKISGNPGPGRPMESYLVNPRIERKC